MGQAGELCPTGTIVSSTGSVTASLSFSGGNATRDSLIDVEVLANLPTACVIVDCAMMTTLVGAEAPGATCAVAAAGLTGCDCTIPMTITHNETAAYVVAGNVLTTFGGRTFEFCRDGSTLNHRETGDNPEFGTHELTLR